MERETARPATLRMASSDEVSMPSVPASSMIARNTSTILTVERMKVWQLRSNLDDLSIFSVALSRIFMHTIHITSKIAAETSWAEKNDQKNFSMVDLVCSAFSDNSSATCDASGSMALKKRKFRKKIPSFGFFQNGKLETRGPLPEKIAQQKAAARSVLERKSGVLRGRIGGIFRRSGRVGGGLIFGSGAFFGCGRVQALALGVHIGHELVAGDGLLLKKIESDLVEKFAVLAEDLLGLFVAALEQLLNFGICGESPSRRRSSS